MTSLCKLIYSSFLFITMVSAQANAQPIERNSITLRLDKRAFPSNSDISFENQVINMLKYKNIYVDPQSEIQIHEESNFVDLNCFDCILREHSLDTKISAPVNDGTEPIMR